MIVGDSAFKRSAPTRNSELAVPWIFRCARSTILLDCSNSHFTECCHQSKFLASALVAFQPALSAYINGDLRGPC